VLYSRAAIAEGNVMRVLIVDDYPGAVEATKLLLELLGHECRTAVDGKAALEALATFVPDVVLLDVGLPDLSGYEVAREIRARTAGRRVFIAALTGWANAEDRILSLAAGIDLHLEKPAYLESLERILAAAQGH
jgi:DNA-binding response OmpR family regulator